MRYFSRLSLSAMVNLFVLLSGFTAVPVSAQELTADSRVSSAPVQDLMTQARRALRAGQYIRPAGHNALEYAQQVLTRIPGHPGALQILRDVLAHSEQEHGSPRGAAVSGEKAACQGLVPNGGCVDSSACAATLVKSYLARSETFLVQGNDPVARRLLHASEQLLADYELSSKAEYELLVGRVANLKAELQNSGRSGYVAPGLHTVVRRRGMVDIFIPPAL